MVWSVPALAAVGKSFLVMLTLAEDVPQELEIVQVKVFTPTVKPVTPEVGLFTLVTVAPPAVTVQTPVPTKAVFPVKVAVVAQTVWFVPTVATVGGVSLVMLTSAKLVPQLFEIVHLNVFTPKLNPVTPEFGLFMSVTVAEPAVTVQIPVPEVGALPESALKKVLQVTWLVPTVAVVGVTSLVIVKVAEVEPQPFVIVHLKVFIPTVKPVTPEAGLLTSVTLAPPAVTVHVPVFPAAGTFPVKLAMVKQVVWFTPTVATAGAGFLVILTLLTEAGQVPLVIVQVKVLMPKPKPVTVEVGELGLVIVPAPAVSVHCPVPTVGVFPAKVKVVLQVLWSVPAFATVGVASLVIVTSLVEGVHVPLETVHLNTLIPTPKLVTWEVGEVEVTTEPPP
jgi:hypothetical protein